MLDNINLREYEKRALLAGKADKDHFLFDDLLHVPLVFVGHGIKQNTKITQQVRTIDIFPTISDILKLPNRDNEIDGRSLLPLIEGKKMSELVNYIESSHLSLEIITNDVIGIRTSKYKYFRDKDDSKHRVNLFNLIDDPFEDKNVAKKYPEIVNQMEIMLKDLMSNKSSNVENYDEDETKKIEEELKKLGYI